MHDKKALPWRERLFLCAGSLSWWPVHGASAEQVEVEMIHGLAAILAGIDHHAVAVGEAFVAGDPRRGPQQVAEQRAVPFGAVSQRRNMFARRDQHVHRRMRVNVREGVALLVLVDGGGGDASINDLAKEATHGAFSVQERDTFVHKTRNIERCR
jgi:hypothetical protein